MMIKKLLLICLLLISSTAQAVTVNAKIVADDYFSVFVGDSNATSLTQVGGSGATLWYSQGTPFSFELAADQYIYVAAWDSASFGPPHMWIGEFDVGGTTLLSNTTDWVSKYSADIKDPTVAQVQTLAQSAQAWTTPLASMANGSSPYGSLIGGSSANMIWYDQFSGGLAQNGFALFTNAPVTAPIPEPEIYAMMGLGLGLLGWVGRRRKLQPA